MAPLCPSIHHWSFSTTSSLYLGRQPVSVSAMPELNLTVSCQDTSWGENVAVVGSWNRWDKRLFHTLHTSSSSYPVWSTTVPLPRASPIEYKYVIVRDGSIVRWETDGHRNRIATAPASAQDVYGRLDESNALHPEQSGAAPQTRPWTSGGVVVGGGPGAEEGLDELEKAVVKVTAERKSWRQRLSFVRELFAEPDTAAETGFQARNVDHLATVSVYLTFLASGQILCEEDGGHHRPNHHANEARQIEAVLAAITAAVAKGVVEEGRSHEAYVPYIVRNIFPQLPSYSSQFTASVPLTRIRDIAHRGDIPHDFKQEIKHTLQNKLHRCAGPEDLQTSAKLLERINNGDYSPEFKEQFRIFHAELCEFFNASSLDDRLRYLEHNKNTNSAGSLASQLLEMKHGQKPAVPQMEVLTKLRKCISELPLMASTDAEKEDLPSEDVQKTRLADIDLENYAFLLLAGVAKDVEHQSLATFPWGNALHSLSLALQNIGLSGICPTEVEAASAELSTLHDQGEKRDLLRVKAAIDRSLCFAESFSSAISDVYSRRATSIGRALGVESHAINVFAEAEIRSNITFQASRIADACAQTCREGLGLPPWDPLYEGKASGKLVHVNHLSELQVDENVAVVAVCRSAEGDEDIPVNVKGIVLGRSLAHLSHLGVRARQAGVVFVCAEDKEVFDHIWKQKVASHVSMIVDSARGLATFAACEEPSEEKSPSAAMDKGDRRTSKEINIKFDSRLTQPIPLYEATLEATSSKTTYASKLSDLAKKSGGLFAAPNGMALPHGMFQKQRSLHSKEYDRLVETYTKVSVEKGGDANGVAKILFSFVQENLQPYEKHCKAIQKAFKKGARVMVRSSANAEDLEDMSGAGLYDSLANIDVHDTVALQKAVASVWASLWTARAASSRAAYGVPHNKVSMAVLVQQMVPADLSFVAFSRDPVSGKDAAYIEVAVGMGETLASAAFAGNPYRFRVHDGDVEMLGFASYGSALIPRDEGLHSKVVDYSQQVMTTSHDFRTRLVDRIAKVVGKLEGVFGGPQDIEGVVTMTENGVEGKVYVVQARPQIL